MLNKVNGVGEIYNPNQRGSKAMPLNEHGKNVPAYLPQQCNKPLELTDIKNIKK